MDLVVRKCDMIFIDNVPSYYNEDISRFEYAFIEEGEEETRLPLR